MMKGQRRNSDCTADTEMSFPSSEFQIHPGKISLPLSSIDISLIHVEDTEHSLCESDKCSKTSKNKTLDSVPQPECTTGSPIKSTRSHGRDSLSSPTSGKTIQDFLANLPEIEDILSDSDEGEGEDVEDAATLLQTPPVSSRNKNVVSFGSVTVRSYERIMSDNPSSACGPSIGIGWAFVQEESTTVDEWDNDRLEEACMQMRANPVLSPKKQKRSNLLLSPKKRVDMLLRVGYSDKEITEMVRNINKTRIQRRNTVINLDNQGLEEAFENARRKLKSALSFPPQTKVAC
jgi:hypothetical protein